MAWRSQRDIHDGMLAEVARYARGLGLVAEPNGYHEHYPSAARRRLKNGSSEGVLRIRWRPDLVLVEQSGRIMFVEAKAKKVNGPAEDGRLHVPVWQHIFNAERKDPVLYVVWTEFENSRLAFRVDRNEGPRPSSAHFQPNNVDDPSSVLAWHRATRLWPSIRQVVRETARGRTPFVAIERGVMIRESTDWRVEVEKFAEGYGTRQERLIR